MNLLERMIDPTAEPVRVLVQGATGRVARRHISLMRGHGTKIVAGVSQSGREQEVEGVPVFTSCADAVAETQAEASVIMVPPLSVLPAVQEAVEAGIGLVVTVTEGVPVLDALRMHRIASEAGAIWIGASTPGLAVPGRIKLGFLPEVALAPGALAVWSKSGTLSYETCLRLKQRGVGQSAWIGVGGDAVKGTRFADLLPAFRHHPQTRGVLLVGEIGGTEEEALADALRRDPLDKPVYALIAGSSAPEGVTMGHAGAMVDGGRGTLASKTSALQAAGVQVFGSISSLVATASEELGKVDA